MTSQQIYTLSSLAAHIQAECIGDPNIEITGLVTLDASSERTAASKVTFLDNPRYKGYLAETKASAVVINQENIDLNPVASLLVAEPYVAFAKLAALFDRSQPPASAGIHPTVQIDPSAKIADDVAIGPFVVIGPEVVLEKGVVIGPHCAIGPRCQIGKGTMFWPNVVCYQDVVIGKNSIIHASAVLGSDGFGNVKVQGEWQKIPQIGGLIIGDNVEIGASTAIDRAAIGNTVIANGVRIDNHVHIAHGVEVGENTAIAGCTGIAGSVKIGKDCLIGGGTGIAGHLEITDNVALTGRSEVSRSINEPGVYSSGTALMDNKEWRKSVARFRHLDQLSRKVATLEKEILALKEKES